MPEDLIINNIPPDRLQFTIELRQLDGWRVRAINVEPDGEYTVVFER
jgi:hypothetical protein